MRENTTVSVAEENQVAHQLLKENEEHKGKESDLATKSSLVIPTSAFAWFSLISCEATSFLFWSLF